MPVSKRDKKVSLTKTSKKGTAMKQQLVESIRKFLDKYDSIFVFTINNMRNGPLKDLREVWRDSRFFFAKRKVMAIALGRTEAEEMQKNIHKLANHLVGQCGLLFTNRPKDQVVQWFQDYSQMEFAKSGFVATETVTLPAGPMPDFSFSLEPHLRSLGLPTQLEKGKIILREDFTVCHQGAKLTPEQANILKLTGKQMAEFKVKIVCMWSKDGSFERFKVPKEAKQQVSENNTDSQKKKTKKISDSGIKSEKEIIELFDQQSINEPKMFSHQEHTPPAKKEPEFSKQSESKDQVMKEDFEEVKTNAVTTNISTESAKKAAQATDSDVANEYSDNSSQNEDSKKLTNTKLATKTSQAVKIKKEELEEHVLNKEMDHVETMKPLEESPKITKQNPRRSLRTPKPIRRSPEEKQSVKKLTESSKKAKSALKDKVTKPTRSTPRKSVSKKIFEESEDVEMAE